MAEAKAAGLPGRSEVAPGDCWDLSDLYPSREAWEEDFEAAVASVKELDRYRGRLGEGPHIVRDHLDMDVACDRRFRKLYTYASCRSDEDLSHSGHLGLKERITGLLTRAGEKTAFFRSELTALPAETLERYLAAEELAPYRFVLEQVVRHKPYTLGEAEERILALSGEVSRAPMAVFGQLNNADMRFGFITDEDGNKVEVTHGSYTSFLSKRSREVRKAFFDTYYAGFEAHKHTLAALLAAGVKRNIFYARARGFPSARAAALFGNNVPEEVYDNLLETVHGKLDVLARYYDLRGRLLNLDAVHFYDLFVPVVPDINVRHTYDEAVERVLGALAPLGGEYTEALGHGLRGGWVDRYENRGKRSGAYSGGCYDSNPYILLNFKEDNLDHVYTLAHEAGHSMHSWHARRAQPPQDADYSIFVAEVASTFNEALLTEHLLAATDDPRMKAYIINREIDDIRSTLFRQVMFAEFEHRVHQRAEQDQPLSLDDLTGLYHEILERYYGPRFALDAALDLECFRIPHFYYGFYVFQYATGIAAAFALARRVLGGGQAELDAYMGFLRAGGSKYPIDILAAAGVDMTSPAPVAAILEHFERRIGELEELTARLGAS